MVLSARWKVVGSLTGALAVTMMVSSCVTSRRRTPQSPDRRNQAPEQPQNPDGKDQAPPKEPPSSPSACQRPEALVVPPGGRLSTVDEPLLSLTAEHPRIFVTPERLAAIKNLLKNGDPVVSELASGLAKK